MTQYSSCLQCPLLQDLIVKPAALDTVVSDRKRYTAGRDKSCKAVFCFSASFLIGPTCVRCCKLSEIIFAPPGGLHSAAAAARRSVAQCTSYRWGSSAGGSAATRRRPSMRAGGSPPPPPRYRLQQYPSHLALTHTCPTGIKELLLTLFQMGSRKHCWEQVRA